MIYIIIDYVKQEKLGKVLYIEIIINLLFGIDK